MQIKKLRLTGFKSFVEPSELHIEPGLTGIVGPNGCGKSNLLEALRWVMGETSAKSLRGGGMDDVIFAGTESRPSRDFAEVVLHCDTQGALMAGLSHPRDGDELEIIRRIDRGTGSAYRANGRDVRAKDVALIFADAATGAHSPALVSQGKIAHIIAAKPTERRAMLEEAAGISGLHVRRKDAEQKLRATETNLQRLSEVVTEFENRAAALRRQARTADKYRELTTQIRSYEARLIYARWRDAAAAEDAARATAKSAEADVAAAQAQLESLGHARRTATNALERARIEVQKLRLTDAALQADIARLAGEARNVEERLADLARQQQAILNDREQESDLDRKAHEALSRLDAEAKDIAKQLAELHQSRQPMVDADRRAQHHRRDAEIALAQAQAKAASESADRRIAEAALASASDAQRKALQRLEKLNAERAALGDSASLTRAATAAAEAADASEQAAMDAEQALSIAETARDQAAEAQSQVAENLAAQRATTASLKAEIAALRRALADSQSADAGQTLMDQLHVQAGYEKALAAALGDDLSAGFDASAPRHWQDGASPARPADTPKKTAPLSDFVQAPALLSARLSQIFVVDQDDGQPLQLGQRLVSRSGQLRRWDGFCSHGDGGTASQRLIQRNRLAELDAAFPDTEAALHRAETENRVRTEAHKQAHAAAKVARKALSAADEARRQALRRADQAAAALARYHDQADALDERIAEASAHRRDADEALAERIAALALLPDDSHSRAMLAEAETANENARRLASDSRQRLADHDHRAASLVQRQAVVSADSRNWQSRSGDSAKRISEMDSRTAALARDITMLADQPAKFAREITVSEEKRAALLVRLAAAEQAEAKAEAETKAADEALEALRETSAHLREARAAAAAQCANAESRRVEMGRLSGERFTCPPPLLPHRGGFAAEEVGSVDAESAQHDRYVIERDNLGPVNLVAANELTKLEAERSRIAHEIEDLQQAVNRLRGSIGNLNREGRQRLLAAFETANTHFQRLFTQLFGGGAAHLQWIDSDDPLEAGLEIMAQPPGKKLGSLSLLSGGEQALTAIAMIFGLFLTNPSPICVLDEVDAPLDDANIERFCDLLDHMVRETRTRYLIVTHNAVTMARMHRLYGVTMIERGVSRLVSVDLGGAEELLAAE